VTRIFVSLAWLALVLTASALVVGLSISDFHENHSPEMRDWATVHRLTGVASALAVVRVMVQGGTSFMGGVGWCKKV
jgi:hypothetical protein